MSGIEAIREKLARLAPQMGVGSVRFDLDDVAALLRAYDQIAAERDRLLRLMGGDRVREYYPCTCTEVRPAEYGPDPQPAEWEQDPWCPTHPDMVGTVLPEIERLRAAAVERCRECRDEGEWLAPVPLADFILWGKLLPPEAFGPRCTDHAVKWIPHLLEHADQHAVFDLRPFRLADQPEDGA